MNAKVDLEKREGEIWEEQDSLQLFIKMPLSEGVSDSG